MEDRFNDNLVQFQHLLQQTLLSFVNDDTAQPILNKSWYKELLKEEPPIMETAKVNMSYYEDLRLKIKLKTKELDGSWYFGLARRPFYKILANNLYCLIQMPIPTFPTYLKLPVENQLMSEPKGLERIKGLEDKLLKEQSQFIEELANYRISNTNTIKKFLFYKFFSTLVPADFNLLFGYFETEGSILRKLNYNAKLVLPPCLDTCLLTFNALNTIDPPKTPKALKISQLTVGARALTKHCHRDKSHYFWAMCSGSEPSKNDLANDMLVKIMEDIGWINLHYLPNETLTFEIRHKLGYGARWHLIWSKDADGQDEMKVAFRGLLEPQMLDGHLLGWSH